MSTRWTVRSTSRYIGNVVPDTSKSSKYLRNKNDTEVLHLSLNVFSNNSRNRKYSRNMEKIIRTVNELANV